MQLFWIDKLSILENNIQFNYHKMIFDVINHAGESNAVNLTVFLREKGALNQFYCAKYSIESYTVYNRHIWFSPAC